MKGLKNIFLPCIALVVGCILACTEVEMVDMSARPVSSLIRMSFNWNGQEADKPERMHVIAVRNIMTLRSHGYVESEDGHNPWFGLSEPIIEEIPEETPEENPEENPEEETPPTEGEEGTEGETGTAPANETGEGETGEGEGSEGEGETGEGEGTEEGSGTGEGETGEGEGEGEEEQPEEETRYPFRLRGGEYNILVVNTDKDTDNMELRCLRQTDENGEEITVEDTSLKAFLEDNTRKSSELFLCIKPLAEKPEIVKDKDLPDFNPKFEYIDGVPRIFYGMKTGVKVVPGVDTQVQMDMQPISQEVQVLFTVELDGNIQLEGDPIVEMSGICGHFNLMEEYVDTTKLYRSAVTASLESQSGNLYVYKARFHTLGIIPSYDPDFLVGPGVFQVAVKAVSANTDHNNPEGRYVYAGINPYTELNESQIIVIGDDGKPRMRFSREPVVVNVEKHLVINEKFLIDSGKGLGWEQHDPDNDIDIDI